jgi:hypothetical protein
MYGKTEIMTVASHSIIKNAKLNDFRKADLFPSSDKEGCVKTCVSLQAKLKVKFCLRTLQSLMWDGVIIQPFFTSALSGHKFLLRAGPALLPGLESVVKL